ncbi:MAG TPA: hypothetical protein VGY77_00285, partial [Gemmataceae bacterium]|nr:hypothetical protein [Gemmataceae bacterium]
MRYFQIAVSALFAGFLGSCQSGPIAAAEDAQPRGIIRSDAAAAPVRSQKPDEPAPAAIRRTVFEVINVPFPPLKDGEVSVKIRAHVNGAPIFDEEVRELVHPALLSLPPSLL